MGYRMVTWPMTSHDLESSNSWRHYAYSAISRKLLELETSNLVCTFVSGMPSGCTNNFPESGCGVGHVTPTIFGSTVGYPSDSLASCFLLKHEKWCDISVDILAVSAIWWVSAKFCEILRKLEIAVQGHPRSSILVPIESTYIDSYWPLILTLDVSLTFTWYWRI